MTTIAPDNRHARVKWGETIWGASAASNVIAWGIEVDWNGDGLFDANESNRVTSIYGFRGRREMLQAPGGGFEPYEAGRYSITLDNSDGRYDAYNTSSPLYPNVTYGKDIRITVRDLSGSAAPYPVFYGIVTDIITYTGPDGSEEVKLIAEDAWTYLRNSYPLLAHETFVGGAKAAILYLRSINWPARWGWDLQAVLAYGSDGLPSVSSGTLGNVANVGGNKSKTCGAILKEISEGDCSAFFIAADGKATLTKTLTTHPASVLNVTQDIIHKDISVSQPWANLRHIVRITCHQRQYGAGGAELWSLGAYIQAAAGETVSFMADYSYAASPPPVFAYSVDTPVPTTDWTANTASDGTGTDKTADCTFSIVDYGGLALITFTNGSGGTVYLVTARITGLARYEFNAIDVASATPATASGQRALVINAPHTYLTGDLQDVVDIWGPLLSSANPSIVVKMSGRPSQQFLLELADCVTVTLAKHGISGRVMRVGGIEIQSQGNCQDVLTTLFLEPTP